MDATPPSDEQVVRLHEPGRRRHALLLMILRAIFVVLLVVAVAVTLASQFSILTYPLMVGVLLTSGAAATIVVAVDILTPNKRLASLAGVYLGLCFGIVGALGFSKLVDVVVTAWEVESPVVELYLNLAKTIVAIIFCYLAVSFVLTTKDDFRVVLPYIEFEKQLRGARSLLLDTSSLIDGRIVDLVAVGLVEGKIIVPRFVVDELQVLSDSRDRTKRDRGRRGLELLRKLQETHLDVSIESPRVAASSVDHALVEYASRQSLRLVTTDSNLARVAEIERVQTVDIARLARRFKRGALPGEIVDARLVRPGENTGQAIGYLDDGTMIVVEDAAEVIGALARIEVVNALDTAGGRMLFGRIHGDGLGSHPRDDVGDDQPNGIDATPSSEHAGDARASDGGHGTVPDASDASPRGSSLSEAATNQPRTTARGDGPRRKGSARNPRRS